MTEAEETKEFGYMEMTRENATEFVQGLDKERAEQCGAEIAKVLEKYKCVINGVPVIVDGRIVVQVEIVPGG